MPACLALREGHLLSPREAQSVSSPACRPGLPRAALHSQESTSHIPAVCSLCQGWAAALLAGWNITEIIPNEGKEGAKMLPPFNPACPRDRRKPPRPPCAKSCFFCLQRNKPEAFPCSSFSPWTVTAHLAPRQHQEENESAAEACSSYTFFPLLPRGFRHMWEQGEGRICLCCCVAGRESPQTAHLD